MKKYKAILFDMDGVIVDSEKSYYQRKMHFIEMKNITLKRELFNDLVGRALIDGFQIIIDNSNAKQDAEFLVSEFNAWKQGYPINYAEVLEPTFKQTRNQLYDAGYKIGLATSSGQQVVTQALKQNKIDQVFDVIVNGDMVKTKKPAPDIYELMVSKLGIKPHQCLAVEDTEVGILSAKLAGCDVVFKRNQRYAVNHQTADYVIDHLAELLEILK